MNLTKHTVLTLASFFLSQVLSAQSLQSYIQEAQINNPKIKALESRFNIAQEKVNEVNALPDTKLSAGYFVSEPETRTGPQRARFSVSQMLPWFGTITARENYASSMADAEFVEIVIGKRKIALSVAQSYYELYAIRAKQIVLEENIRLLKSYEQLALNAVEVDRASTVDVLRLQIRQNGLQQQKETLQQDYLAERAAFNKLMNRKESEAVDVVSALKLPSEDPNYSQDDLQLNPELLKYDRLYESIEQIELLNQKENAPKIGFGLDYLPVSERSEMNFSDNGKDIVMPTVSISIPIFSNKYASVSKQNEMRKQEIRSQKNEQLNTLQSAYAKALAARNTARITVETQQKNLKKAKNAEEILIKSYETATRDFNDILDIQELQLKFQTKQIDAVRMYYGQSAIINYLIN